MSWIRCFNERPSEDGDFDDDNFYDESDMDIDYEIPYIRDAPKVGRDELCPCGSGKKFKKCCLLLYSMILAIA